jgi:hypothetical protein
MVPTASYRQLPYRRPLPCPVCTVLWVNNFLVTIDKQRNQKMQKSRGKSHHTHLYRMYILCSMYHTYVIPVFAKLSLVTETWGIFDNRHLSLINIYLLLSSPQEANPPPIDEGKILLRTCLAATVFQHKGSKI